MSAKHFTLKFKMALFKYGFKRKYEGFCEGLRVQLATKLFYLETFMVPMWHLLIICISILARMWHLIEMCDIILWHSFFVLSRVPNKYATLETV